VTSSKTPCQPHARKRLVRRSVLWTTALVLEFALLLWLWPMTVVRGWPIRVLIASVAVIGLATYVLDALLHSRGRVSLKVLLAMVTLVAIGCGLFANRAVMARKQRQRVEEVVSLGVESLMTWR